MDTHCTTCGTPLNTGGSCPACGPQSRFTRTAYSTPPTAAEVAALIAEAEKVVRTTTSGPYWQLGSTMLSVIRAYHARLLADEAAPHCSHCKDTGWIWQVGGTERVACSCTTTPAPVEMRDDYMFEASFSTPIERAWDGKTFKQILPTTYEEMARLRAAARTFNEQLAAKDARIAELERERDNWKEAARNYAVNADMHSARVVERDAEIERLRAQEGLATKQWQEVYGRALDDKDYACQQLAAANAEIERLSGGDGLDLSTRGDLEEALKRQTTYAVGLQNTNSLVVAEYESAKKQLAAANARATAAERRAEVFDAVSEERDALRAKLSKIQEAFNG